MLDRGSYSCRRDHYHSYQPKEILIFCCITKLNSIFFHWCLQGKFTLNNVVTTTPSLLLLFPLAMSDSFTDKHRLHLSILSWQHIWVLLCMIYHCTNLSILYLRFNWPQYITFSKFLRTSFFPLGQSTGWAYPQITSTGINCSLALIILYYGILWEFWVMGYLIFMFLTTCKASQVPMYELSSYANQLN